MPESGLAVLKEFKEVFDELGEQDGFVKLRRGARTNVQIPGSAPGDVALGNPIVDDANDRMKLNLAVPDIRVFRIWGGVFMTPTDELLPEAVLGRKLIEDMEAALNAAMKPGGGIVYLDELYAITAADEGRAPYQRDFTVRSFVMQWYVTAVRMRPAY